MAIKNLTLQEKVDLVNEIYLKLDEKIYGQSHAKDKIVKAFLSWEHVLIESLPGLWKTALCNALAEATGLHFTRIQGSPDLMPQDILGYTTLEWEKIDWPIMTNILLVDEINRINPKTLSALLSAMAEGVIVWDDWKYVQLPNTFFVVATMNPTENVWTFEMPEATKDRFAIKVFVEKEKDSLIAASTKNPDEIICDVSENMMHTFNEVFDNLDPKLSRFDFIRESLLYWPSIRAWLQFIKVCKVSAFLDWRTYVTIEDLKENLIPVFIDKVKLKDDFDLTSDKLQWILERYKDMF